MASLTKEERAERMICGGAKRERRERKTKVGGAGEWGMASVAGVGGVGGAVKGGWGFERSEWKLPLPGCRAVWRARLAEGLGRARPFGPDALRRVHGGRPKQREQKRGSRDPGKKKRGAVTLGGRERGKISAGERGDAHGATNGAAGGGEEARWTKRAERSRRRSRAPQGARRETQGGEVGVGRPGAAGNPG